MLENTQKYRYFNSERFEHSKPICQILSGKDTRKKPITDFWNMLKNMRKTILSNWVPRKQQNYVY